MQAHLITRTADTLRSVHAASGSPARAQGNVSFADAVRAFKRKKVIESLMQGGKARVKLLEYREK